MEVLQRAESRRFGEKKDRARNSFHWLSSLGKTLWSLCLPMITSPDFPRLKETWRSFKTMNKKFRNWNSCDPVKKTNHVLYSMCQEGQTENSSENCHFTNVSNNKLPNGIFQSVFNFGVLNWEMITHTHTHTHPNSLNLLNLGNVVDVPYAPLKVSIQPYKVLRSPAGKKPI